MSAGYTSGPWEVADMGWSTGFQHGGQVHAMQPTGRYLKADDGSFYPETPSSGVLICSYYKSGLRDGDGYANARLIAAAPDLLDALRAAKMWLAPVVPDEVVAQINAAIAKATGAGQ